MTKTSQEPQQLLARLERKFVRKVQAEQSRRKTRGFRNSLARMDGVAVRSLGEDDVFDGFQYQETY